MGLHNIESRIRPWLSCQSNLDRSYSIRWPQSFLCENFYKEQLMVWCQYTMGHVVFGRAKFGDDLFELINFGVLIFHIRRGTFFISILKINSAILASKTILYLILFEIEIKILYNTRFITISMALRTVLRWECICNAGYWQLNNYYELNERSEIEFCTPTYLHLTKWSNLANR